MTPDLTADGPTHIATAGDERRTTRLIRSEPGGGGEVNCMGLSAEACLPPSAGRPPGSHTRTCSSPTPSTAPGRSLPRRSTGGRESALSEEQPEVGIAHTVGWVDAARRRASERGFLWRQLWFVLLQSLVALVTNHPYKAGFPTLRSLSRALP